MLTRNSTNLDIQNTKRDYIYHAESETTLMNHLFNEGNIKSDDSIQPIKESDSHTISLKPLGDAIKEDDTELGPLPRNNENISLNTESLNFNEPLHRRLLNTRLSYPNKSSKNSPLSRTKHQNSKIQKVNPTSTHKECNCKLFLDPKIPPKDRLIYIKPKDIDSFQQDYHTIEAPEDQENQSTIELFDSALIRIFNERIDCEEEDTDEETEENYQNVMKRVRELRNLFIHKINENKKDIQNLL